MSRRMTKPTQWPVRLAKTQISLGIRPVWSESPLSAWRKLGSLAIHWAHSEDWSEGRMPRLIWVFAGRTSFCWFCGEAAQLLVVQAFFNFFPLTLGFIFSVIIVQIGHIIGGNFNIHIWACSGYFTVTYRGARLYCHNEARHYDRQMSHLMTKPTEWLCAQRRLRSAWALLSLISLRCVLNG